MHSLPRTGVAALTVAALAALLSTATSARQPATSIAPGTRVLLDAHNSYPYNGRWADRTDRALEAGVPVAIEQDLVWRPGAGGAAGRSIVSHGEPYDGTEPGLREYFFERIRPIVERAVKGSDRSSWPLITLNLDLKSNEPEHHQALWSLLGEYEAWLTTAERTADGSRPAPLDVKPVLVLTGDSDAQAKSFHDDVPVGGRLRLFGAIPFRAAATNGKTREQVLTELGDEVVKQGLPRATNYRRWWNAPWGVVEAGGQPKAGEWTAEEDARLRTLVNRAHEAGLWVRFWTVNGHAPGYEKESGWTASYNVGSQAAAEQRWKALIAAGADFVATDQYELFGKLKAQGR
jgi:hypothetical protein